MKDTTRGIRRQKTYNYALKQKNIALLNSHSTVKTLGYYKKQAHMDCGRPKCGLCGNPRKNKKSYCYNDTKKHEIISNIDFWEQIKNDTKE